MSGALQALAAQIHSSSRVVSVIFQHLLEQSSESESWWCV